MREVHAVVHGRKTGVRDIFPARGIMSVVATEGDRGLFLAAKAPGCGRLLSYKKRKG